MVNNMAGMKPTKKNMSPSEPKDNKNRISYYDTPDMKVPSVKKVSCQPKRVK